MRGLLFVLFACGPAVVPQPATVTPSEPEIVEPERPGAFLVHDGRVLGDGGPFTLVGPTGRCTSETPTLSECDGWVAFDGETVAVAFTAERLGAPALGPAAPYVGGFIGTTWGYRIESPEGDALCPGTPTEIVFLSDVSEGTAVGRSTIDAPIVREEGQGVVAMIETPEGRWVLLEWPGRRRLVTTEGEIVAELELPLPDDCDCCN